MAYHAAVLRDSTFFLLDGEKNKRFSFKFKKASWRTYACFLCYKIVNLLMWIYVYINNTKLKIMNILRKEEEEYFKLLSGGRWNLNGDNGIYIFISIMIYTSELLINIIRIESYYFLNKNKIEQNNCYLILCRKFAKQKNIRKTLVNLKNQKEPRQRS